MARRTGEKGEVKREGADKLGLGGYKRRVGGNLMMREVVWGEWGKGTG